MVITTSNLNRIIQSNPYNQKLLSIISIIEAHLNLVSKEHLDTLGKTNINEITLKDLGMLYSSIFCKNSGLNGVCWEYAVYNGIYYNDIYIQDLLNLSINYLSGENTFHRLNAILWGGEKENLPIDNIKENIDDEDCIWTHQGLYKFNDYVEIIYKAFRQKEFRNQLPKSMSDIWKSDLFVKKDSSNIWYAVSVKWNKNDVKHSSGLSIGIHYEHMNIQKNEINPFLEKKGFVRCSIPYAFNFGEYYACMFRFFEVVLQKINLKKKNTLRLNFATSEEYQLYLSLYDLRKVSCYDIITFFKYKYNYMDGTTIKSEILLMSNKDINLVKLGADNIKNITGTIVIPT